LTIASIAAASAMVWAASAAGNPGAASMHRFVVSVGHTNYLPWLVPRGVKSIVVDAYGGQGAPNAASKLEAGTVAGGKGAHVHAQLAVKPGEKLLFLAPEWAGMSNGCDTAQGGGAPSILTTSGATVLTAGGGGGTAASLDADPSEGVPSALAGGAGGASGSPGSPGQSSAPGAAVPTAGAPGGAATSKSPGAGGAAGAGQDTIPGSTLVPALAGEPGETDKQNEFGNLSSFGFAHVPDDTGACGGAGAASTDFTGGDNGTGGGGGGGGYHTGGGGGGGGATYTPGSQGFPTFASASGGGGGGGASFVEKGAKHVSTTQGVWAGFAKIVVTY
jgi:hypothetical protein